MIISRVARTSVVIGLWCALSHIAGADDAQPPDQQAAATTAPTVDTAASPASKRSRYDLPEGGVKELLTFVKEIRAYQPVTPAEKIERSLKLYTTVENALAKVARMATAEDRQLEGFDDAYGLHLVFRTIVFSTGPRAGTAEEKQQLIADVKATLLASPRPSKDAVMAARKVVRAIELRDSPQTAIDSYREFGNILMKSTDPETASDGAKMLGAARRLELLGKPLELSGTLVDGAKLDWSQYRGKVVLIDFWATWCGPCRKELPNVKKCFDDYHARGFDVLGVSLDDDRELLDKYLADEKLPWPNLHDGGSGQNPLVVKYGIPGVPTVFLVDKQGIVVSIDARGPELPRQLELLLGPPAESAGSEKNIAAEDR